MRGMFLYSEIKLIKFIELSNSGCSKNIKMKSEHSLFAGKGNFFIIVTRINKKCYL